MNGNSAPESSIAFYECIDNTTKETIFVSEAELNTYPDRYTRVKFKYEKPVPIVVDKSDATPIVQSEPKPKLSKSAEELLKHMKDASARRSAAYGHTR